MAGEFKALCAELSSVLSPALVRLGFTAPADPFSRHIVSYDFRRATPAGTHTFSVLFNKYRHPQFGVQLCVEPVVGFAELQSKGGELIIGGLSSSTVFWPVGVRPFRAAPSRLDRLLRRHGSTPSTAVQRALTLMPEVEEWWNVQRSTRHILAGR